MPRVEGPMTGIYLSLTLQQCSHFIDTNNETQESFIKCAHDHSTSRWLEWDSDPSLLVSGLYRLHYAKLTLVSSS